jgi:homoserine/homoserine lactone efflux protein
MSSETWLSFLLATAAASLSPGPAVVMITSQSVSHGINGAIRVIAGGELALAVNYSLVALGLGVVLASLPDFFTFLRYAGAAYLMWFGLMIVYSSLRTSKQSSNSSSSQLFKAGFLMQISNPKSLLFISALVPQFLSSTFPIWQQILILAATAIGTDTIICLVYALLSSKAANIVSYYQSSYKFFSVSCGSFLIIAGIKLAFSEILQHSL